MGEAPSYGRRVSWTKVLDDMDPPWKNGGEGWVRVWVWVRGRV